MKRMVWLIVICGVLSIAWVNPTHAANVTYYYDELHRVIKAQYDDGTTITYTYDDVGNRTVKSVFIQSPPVANNQNGSTPKNTPLNLTLSYTDPDGPGPYTFAILSGPSHGQLSGEGASRTYTPATDYTGPDAFTWKVNDGIADSNEATYSITVTP